MKGSIIPKPIINQQGFSSHCSIENPQKIYPVDFDHFPIETSIEIADPSRVRIIPGAQ